MRTLFLLLSMALIVGCGDSGVPEPAQDSAVEEAAVEPKAQVDTAQPDTVAAETVQPDASQEDGDTSSSCLPGEGCFGESCDSADDCFSGLCTMHIGSQVCSKTCDEECPPGWSCTLVSPRGSDPVQACVSDVVSLCRPCSAHADCTVNQIEAPCVSYGDAGAFCGAGGRTTAATRRRARTPRGASPARARPATAETVSRAPTTTNVRWGRTIALTLPPAPTILAVSHVPATPATAATASPATTWTNVPWRPTPVARRPSVRTRQVASNASVGEQTAIVQSRQPGFIPTSPNPSWKPNVTSYAVGLARCFAVGVAI